MAANSCLHRRTTLFAYGKCSRVTASRSTPSHRPCSRYENIHVRSFKKNLHVSSLHYCRNMHYVFSSVLSVSFVTCLIVHSKWTHCTVLIKIGFITDLLFQSVQPLWNFSGTIPSKKRTPVSCVSSKIRGCSCRLHHGRAPSGAPGRRCGS